MSAADPVMARFAAHCQAVMDLMHGGQLDPHAATAALVADALAASVAQDIRPDTADELLNMARTWAVQRAQRLTAEVLLAESPVPDDLSGLDGEASTE